MTLLHASLFSPTELIVGLKKIKPRFIPCDNFSQASKVSIFEPNHKDRGFFNPLPFLVRLKQMLDPTGAHFPEL
jgi:hypothetical protein